MNKKIQFLIIASLFAVTLTFSQSAFAATKPGWGFGDDNHEHVGPPGQSDKFDNDGDKDHKHVGPSGESDRLGDDNNQGDNENGNGGKNNNQDTALNQFMLHWFNLLAGMEKGIFSHLHDS